MSDLDGRLAQALGLDLATATLGDRPRPGRAAIVAILYTPVIRLGDELAWQVTDELGVDWICEALDGWADMPTSNAPVLARTFDHGAWSGPGWFGPRALVLTGVIVAPDRPALQRALHQLRRVYADALENAAVLAVDELDGEKRLGVRAAHDRLAVHYIAPIAARVTVALVAPWPVKRSPELAASTAGFERGGGRHYNRPSVDGGFRKYGPLGSTGDIHLDLIGNAPIRPRFLIAGPCVRPSIIAPEQDRRLTFDITLSGGDVLGVDTDTHSVLLNDLANRRYVLTADSAWFDLRPGDNHLQYRPADAGGSLTVYYSNGWW